MEYKYRVIAGQYPDNLNSEQINQIASVWVIASNKGEAFRKAVKKIVLASRGKIDEEDIEHLKAYKLNKVES